MSHPPTPLKKKTTKRGDESYGINTYGRTFNLKLYTILKQKIRETSGIYILQPIGYTTSFKVGYGKNLLHRLDNYCTYYPHGYRLYMLLYNIPSDKVRAAEKMVHSSLVENETFAEKPTCGNRSKKTEWFRVNDQKKYTSRQIFAVFLRALNDIIKSNVWKVRSTRLAAETRYSSKRSGEKLEKLKKPKIFDLTQYVD